VFVNGRAERSMEAEAYTYSGMDRQRVWWWKGVFLKISCWLGRQDVYVAGFLVGVPNLLRGGNRGAA